MTEIYNQSLGSDRIELLQSFCHKVSYTEQKFSQARFSIKQFLIKTSQEKWFDLYFVKFSPEFLAEFHANFA